VPLLFDGFAFRLAIGAARGAASWVAVASRPRAAAFWRATLFAALRRAAAPLAGRGV